MCVRLHARLNPYDAVSIYHGICASHVHHGRSALSSAPSSSCLGATPVSSTFDIDIERRRLLLARHRFKFVSNFKQVAREPALVTPVAPSRSPARRSSRFSPLDVTF